MSSLSNTTSFRFEPQGWGLENEMISGAILDVLDWTSIHDRLGKLCFYDKNFITSQRYFLFDTFGYRILKSGKLLVSTKEDGKNTVVVPELLGDLLDSYPGFTKKTYEGWKLLSLGNLELKRETYLCKNKEGKGIAQVVLTSLKGKQRINLISFAPLRGYKQESLELYRFLKYQAGLLFPTIPHQAICLALDLEFDRKTGLELRLNQPVKTVLRHKITSCLYEASGQIQGIIQDVDPECLHFYRVQLRTARSLLSLFKPLLGTFQMELKAVLSRIMTCTNVLRDLDVFLSYQNEFQSLIGSDTSSESLFSRFKEEREKELLKVVQRLSGREFKTDLDRMYSLTKKNSPIWVGNKSDRPIEIHVKKQIANIFFKIRNATLILGTDPSSRELHELRLLHKRFRYLLDLFLELSPHTLVQQLADTLKTSQKNLGNYVDAEFQLSWLNSQLEQNSALWNDQDKRGIMSLLSGIEKKSTEFRSIAIEHIHECIDSDTEALVSKISESGFSR